MRLSLNVSQKQVLKLRQILTPKLIQMLKTFHVSYTDLLQQVNDEIKDNVFLEVVRFDKLTEHRARSKDETGHDVSEYLSSEHRSKGLYEMLMDQLEFEHLGQKEHDIAAELIEHINDRGYIDDYPAIRDQIVKKFDVADRKVGDVLKIIQSFEPEGVGARSLKECLLIQVEAHEFDHEKLRDVFREVITHHLDELSEKKFAKIAKKLGIEEDGVEAIAEFIKNNLNPNPAISVGGNSEARHVVPSFEVEWRDGKVILTNLEQTMGIQVGISQNYDHILNDPNVDQPTKDFLQEKLKKAEELVENIKKRHENLERLATYIMNKQRFFVEKGPIFLEPLLQKEVAKYLGISNSTVSRIVSSKYVQTPHGMFSFKQLCPRDHFGKTSVRLMLIIRELVKEHPDFSDEKIARLLKLQGINIARRTVAKHRLLSGVASSFSRNESIKDHPEPSL